MMGMKWTCHGHMTDIYWHATDIKQTYHGRIMNIPHNPAGADKSEGAGAGAHGSECLADVPTKPWNPQQASTGTQRVQSS